VQIASTLSDAACLQGPTQNLFVRMKTIGEALPPLSLAVNQFGALPTTSSRAFIPFCKCLRPRVCLPAVNNHQTDLPHRSGPTVNVLPPRSSTLLAKWCCPSLPGKAAGPQQNWKPPAPLVQQFNHRAARPKSDSFRRHNYHGRSILPRILLDILFQTTTIGSVISVKSTARQ